ncbi:hypothetical protein, partial [Pseudomonas sp. GP01-A8]|uniref:hypothetical protein n=1 Tax=Pseudomonas sp. GP01-A8 TaxID=2070565 RepID=UPI001C48160F
MRDDTLELIQQGVACDHEAEQPPCTTSDDSQFKRQKHVSRRKARPKNHRCRYGTGTQRDHDARNQCLGTFANGQRFI